MFFSLTQKWWINMLIEFVINQVRVSAFNSPILAAWTSLSICLSLRFESTTATCSQLNHFALRGYYTELLCVGSLLTQRYSLQLFPESHVRGWTGNVSFPRVFTSSPPPTNHSMVTWALTIKRIHTSESMGLTSHSDDSLLNQTLHSCYSVTSHAYMYLTVFPQIMAASLFLRAMRTVIFISVQLRILTAIG